MFSQPLKNTLTRFTNPLVSRRMFSAAAMSQPKIGFLGGGRMAESIITAILASGKITTPDHIMVCDVHEERLQFLKNKFGVRTTTEVNDSVADRDVVVLACKPQNIEEIAATISVPLTGVLLSIAAGAQITDLCTLMRTKAVVRSMPNTPAAVLEGMTVWKATSEASTAQKAVVKSILASIGDEIEVKEEYFLDMATAVCGSGPAYVFLTMEAMVDAAVHMGFPRVMAERLVMNTIKGSASYAMKSGIPLSTLRNDVTSPGGTTASALYALEKGGYRTVVADAIWAAYRRTLELGNSNPNVGPGRSKYDPHFLNNDK